MGIALAVTPNDTSTAVRAANLAALQAMLPGKIYLLPMGTVHLPDNASIEVPANTMIMGHGKDLSFVSGNGTVFRITSNTGTNGRRRLVGFGIVNETEAGRGSLVLFDMQQDMRDLYIADMYFGKSWRHLDAQSLNTTAVGGTLLNVVIERTEFTDASYASRMFRHIIGLTERNCRTHHNQADIWLSSGANAQSIARISIHGEFTDSNQYHLYAGGDVGAGEINGITIETGTLFERAWLVAPPYGTKGGDIILETTTAKKVLGFRLKDGVDFGPPTTGQPERISISPNGGGYIGPIDLGDALAYGVTVPLVSFANTSKLKVSRKHFPVEKEQTELTTDSGIVFRFQNRNGEVMQQSVACLFLVTVVDASNSANSCDYIVGAAGNGNGWLDGCATVWMRQGRGAQVDVGATPFYRNNDPSGAGAFFLGFFKSTAIAKVIVTVKCISGYHG